MNTILGAFTDLGYFPGSRAPRVKHINRKSDKPRVSKVSSDWDAQPRVYPINGVEMDFFTVGQLARALGREAVTLRKWEREGIIPEATYNVPSHDPRGRRRLYTRQQVQGMVLIATEEGILESHARPIRETKFTERVVDLFKDLAP